MFFHFNVRPVPKPRMTRSDRWKKRPSVVAYWEYKDALNIQANSLGYKLTPVLEVAFRIAMPKTWSKRKKELMCNKPHQQKPDLDNLMKAFKDALADEDSFVYKYRNCVKFWGYEDLITVTRRDEDSKLA